MAALVIAATVGCGSDDAGIATPTSHGQNVERESMLGDSFALPFGIIQPDGLEPIGRPADFDEVQVLLNGVPVEGHTLRAAYWVTADDPASVVRAWIDQFDELALDRVVIQRGKASGNPWIEVNHYPSESGTGVEPSDWVTMQLWATDDAPILLVDIHRVETATHEPDVTDDLDDLSNPSTVLTIDERAEGDPLFTVQGATLHLPPGTRALMPTIPLASAGSSSMLAADDADAAIAALMTEASALSDYEEVREPVTNNANGVRVVQTAFVIPAGGWAFFVLAVEAPGDQYATLYITSAPG